MSSSTIARIAPCPLGFLLVATTERGVCAVRLGDNEDSLRHSFGIEYSNAHFLDSNALVNDAIEQLQNYLRGEVQGFDVPLDLRGTSFQREVWRALQSIPRAETRTYTQLAAMVGRPQAVRAAASACAANGIAILVPCHRVVRADGSLASFRWATSRKAQLLEIEGANQPEQLSLPNEPEASATGSTQNHRTLTSNPSLTLRVR